MPPFITVGLPEPRPAFVRLSRQTTPDEVSLVVALLATYGHESSIESLDQLYADFPTVTPGGLVAIHDDLAIYPSCCCGLESWREWLGLLEGGSSVWLGHDPSPWVEIGGEHFSVWPDGGLGEAPEPSAVPVRFTREALATELKRVESDLRDFLDLLGTWTTQRGASIEVAVGLRRRFAESFIDRKLSAEEAP